MKGNGKSRKIILGIGIALLILEIVVISLGATNVLNVKMYDAKADVKSEPFTINENFGESGFHQGEIVIGGTATGAHYYQNGAFTNGYCLDKGMNLGGTVVTGFKLNTYNSAYDVNNLPSENQSQFKWLLDNMLRVNLTSANDNPATSPDTRYVTPEEEAFYKQNMKNLFSKHGKDAGIVDRLLENDKKGIYLTQQYVIWKYTNNTGMTAAQIQTAWENKSYTADRQALADVLMAEANAQKEQGYSSTGNDTIAITKDNDFAVTQNENDVVIGPMTINNSKDKQYILNYTDFLFDGQTLTAGSQVKVYKEDMTTEITNNSYNKYNGKIYLKISNITMSKYNYKYTFKGAITAKLYRTDAKYWIGGSGVQPVVTFSRHPNENLLTVETEFIKKGDVDLALKKTINTIDGHLVDIDNGFNENRHNAKLINIKPLINGENNAEYLLNKTPVNVKRGQTIVYNINIYNEGDIAAKALEINDYLPVGLQLEDIYYKSNVQLTTDETAKNHYLYDAEKGVIVVRLEDTELIPAFDGETLSSDYISVECTVKEDAVGVLTNVSEIRKYQTADGEVRVDRDSTSDNWVSPTGESRTESDKDSNEWRNYSNEQDSWLDGQFHAFIAQDNSVEGKKGDDDDFEKVKVVENSILKIRKVNGAGEGINDIKFNITKKVFDISSPFINYKEEVRTNVSTTNAEILDEQPIEYGEVNKKILEDEEWAYVSYDIEEIELEDSNYFQLLKPITIKISVKNGEVAGYKVAYNNGYKSIGYNTDSQTYKFYLVSGIELQVRMSLEGNTVTAEIENVEGQNGRYGLRFQKVSSSNNQPLAGVTFDAKTTLINRETGEETSELPVRLDATGTDGFTNIVAEPIGKDGLEYIDKYVIKEIDLGANAGYTKLDSDITVKVFKKQVIGQYEVDYWTVECSGATRTIRPGESDSLYIVENGIRYNIVFGATDIDGTPVLTVVVPNAPDLKVPLQIRKVSDEDGTTVIQGTAFKISKGSNVLFENIDSTGTVQLTDNVEAAITSLEYRVEEINAAPGFDNILYKKYIKLNVTLSNGIPTAATAVVYNADNTENTELTAKVAASIVDVLVEGVSVKTVDLKIENTPTVKPIDLALKKVITEIETDGVSKEVTTANGFEAKFDRLTEGTDKVRIDTTKLKNGGTNAEYFLNKTPIEVVNYSVIKYQIRIYNEGRDEAATASKIVDYLPNGLKVLNVYYQNNTQPLVEDTDYKYDEDTNTLEISVLKDKPLIPVYDGGDALSYDYVTVSCEVNTNKGGILTNVAQISEYKTVDAVIPQDRDSHANDWRNPVDNNDNNNETVNRDSYYWENYHGYITNVIEEGQYKNYIGQEDDDDFEKIKVTELDLVLKKIITHINNAEVSTLDAKFHRFQGADISVNPIFMNRIPSVTTAEYYMNKTPIIVGINDKVTYQIRIYNEGTIDATASKIADYIPKGMVFNSASYNGRVLTAGTDYTIDNETNVLTVFAMKDHFIEKYIAGDFSIEDPSYDYITVECTVNGDVRGILTNVAEITKYQIRSGEVSIDRDSQVVGKYGLWVEPTGSNKYTLEGKSGSAWANYYNTMIQTGKFVNYPGQQDDDDFEKVVVATNYSLQVQKVSALDNTKGLENVDIKVGNTTYRTNATGNIDRIGPFEVTDANALDTYTIEEVATNNDKYVKLKKPINIAVKKVTDSTGYVYPSQLFVNLENADFDLATRIDLRDRTFYTLDENDNFVKIKFSFDRTSQRDNMTIKVVIENTIKDSLYDVYLKKVDANGTDIDGAKFTVDGGQAITVENGSTKIGGFVINNYNVNSQQTFNITEVSTPSSYYMLKEPLKLIVTKGYDAEGINYVVTSMKLVSGDKTSETGTDISLANVPLEVANKSVTITAKLEGNQITITVPNTEKEFDLALRKFITKVNGEFTAYSREPVVNVEGLKNGTSTTAIYTHSKTPVEVMASDTVEYTLRIYNEGPRNGFAELIMDDVPEQLEMIAPKDDGTDLERMNAGYRWKMYKETADAGDITYNNKNYVETQVASEAEVILSDYLSSEQSILNLLSGFEAEGNGTLYFRDIKVAFKVKETAPENTVITNYAQITAHLNSRRETVTDRDSTPNVWIENEDDQDIENLVVVKEKKFDLALQKFITAVTTGEDTRDITRREPVFSKDSTATDNDGYRYTPKFEDLPAVEVNYEDKVTYTLRVYNEGEADGYAEEIIDSVPEGTEFVPYTKGDGSINDIYNWVMYKVVTDEEIAALPEGTVVKEINGKSKDGVVTYDKCVITTDTKEADYVVSNYLSKTEGEHRVTMYNTRNPNLLVGFEPTTPESLLDGPAFKDIKVQYKVTYKATTKEETEHEIVNYAQISKHVDRVANDVVDRDSTPNVWIDNEDDQDKEKIKVKYFDLALVKWVSEAIIVEDGVEKVAPGNNWEDLENKYDHRLIYAMYPDTIGEYTDLEPVVKVDIPKSKLNSTVVKFRYKIRVFNEGQIDGYAKEITDYIPAGMKFVPEDNPLWQDVGEGKVITTQLADILLTVGGEPQTVEIVYTWINSEDNLGLIVNMAEISKDYNDYGTPDADSTPNNIKPLEDDIDDAAVLISVRTGNKFDVSYIILAVSVIAVITSGTILIKKYVL